MSVAHDWLLHEAVLAADEILLKAYHVHVLKASDPLKPKDFEAICQALAHNLKGHAIPVEKIALKKAMAAVDANWTDLAPEARGKVLDKAVGYIGEPVVNEILPKVQQTFAMSAADIIAGTKKSSILTHDLSISPALNQTDDRIATFVTKSQGHYITDHFGKRSEGLSATAKAIVAGGLQRGLGSAEIAQKLRDELSAASGRGDGYWDMLAMVFANRARTMTQLASFAEAGIESYMWESVLDEVTSLTCRMMHGRVFPVAHAMAKFQEVEDADSPEDIKTIQPFVSAGKMEGGGTGLYYRGADGERNYVARVVENAVGQKDEVGKFSHVHSDEQMMAAGIHAPPAHPRCRSTLVPSEKGVGGGGKPLPPKPVGPPPKLVGGAAKAKALEDLASFEATSPGHVAAEDVFGEADPSPAFEDHPDFGKIADPGVWAANAVSKKPPIKDLIATQYDLDTKDVTSWIKKPTKPGPVPKVVKYQGKMWILDGHEDLAAQKLLGQSKAYCEVIDLDKALKIPAAPVAPAPVAPVAVPAPVAPSTKPADVILGTKTGGPGGSNKGGFYTGTDGVKRYVKFYSGEAADAQSHGEVLANRVYRDLGIGAPEATTFEHDGKIAFASTILPDVKTLGEAGLTEARAKEVMKGFAADVLVGNWDAAGKGLDNMVVRADGSIARIDQGGSFLMRAQPNAAGDGVRKPGDVLNKITEWDGFFNTSLNPSYAKVAAKAGVTSAADMKDVVVPAIQKIVSLRDGAGGWAKYVENVAPGLNASDKKKMIDMLDARTKLLEDKAKELGVVAAPEPAPAPKMGPPAAPVEIVITQDGLDAAKAKIAGGKFMMSLKGLGLVVDDAPPYLAKKDLLQALVSSGVGGEAKSVPIDDIIATYGTCTKGSVTPKLATPLEFKLAMSKVTDMTVVNVDGKLYVWNGNSKLVAAKLTGQKSINVTVLDATKLVHDPSYVVPSATVASRPAGTVHEAIAHLSEKKLPTDVSAGREANMAPGFDQTTDRYGDRKKFDEQCRARYADTTSKSRDAVHAFSGSYSSAIRTAEEKPEAEARRELGSTYDKRVQQGQDILAFFDKSTPTPVEVWRGIHDLSDAVFKAFTEGDEVVFKCTTSTSWRPDVAIRSFGHCYGPSSSKNNRVIFHAVKSRSGVAIDPFSSARGEDEILFKKGTRFKVLARHRAEGYNDVMVIDMEEIPEDEAPEKAPRKPRKPRKPRAP